MRLKNWEDESNVSRAKAGPVPLTQRGNVVTDDSDAARGGCLDCAKNVQQGRLATAGHTLDGDRLPLGTEKSMPDSTSI